MIYLKLEQANKSYGEKILFQDLNFQISQGQKIALIAKNGSGKTTLLRILSGEDGVEGERAKLFINKEIKIGYLKQEPDFTPNSNVINEALESSDPAILSIKKYQSALIHGDAKQIEKTVALVDELKAWNAEARIKEVLGKLNLKQFDQSINTLSGGQKKRLALAKLIIDDPDFYILDEPTNHLDVEMIEWLEQFLKAKNRTLFMVTHDRYFLENVCNHIVELDQSQIFTFRGNYSNYLDKKALKQENEAIQLDKTKKLFKRELNWIRRQPKARETKAKSRVDKFYQIKEKASKNADDHLLNIDLDTARLGTKILELHAISKSFVNLKIVNQFSYKFKKGEKIGIVGKNGVGKSSFIKLLTKELGVDAGKVVLGDTVVFGHYNQDGIDLTEDKMMIDIVRDVAEYIPLKKGYKLTAAQLLERFMFPREQHRVYASQLSGGEKRRLYLLTILMKNPNFLILDEPTNDLDIVTLTVLENYLQQFPGCVIIVSHDRYFMDKIVDHLFIMQGEGEIKNYNGTYTEYRINKNYSKISTAKTVEKSKLSENKTLSDTPRKLHYLEKKELQKLELEIENLETRKKEIQTSFTNIHLTNEEMTKLSIEFGELNKSLEIKENRWLHLAEFS